VAVAVKGTTDPGQLMAEAVEEVWLGARSGPALDGSNGVFGPEPIG
jgi:hypothetical protein